MPLLLAMRYCSWVKGEGVMRCSRIVAKATMQMLCKQWSMARDLFDGDVGKMFDHGVLTRSTWSRKEDAVKEQEALHTWGIICGMHGGEALAEKALQRNEIIAVLNPCKGGPRVMYKTFSVKGVPKSLES